MLEISCPWCGPRAEIEFTCGGEGGLERPRDSDALNDTQWGNYVFMRRNPRGMHHEQWRHASGCGRWFNVLRDTVSYRFHAVWKFGEPAPAGWPKPPVAVGPAALADAGSPAAGSAATPTPGVRS